jgi:hypothetical protein
LQEEARRLVRAANSKFLPFHAFLVLALVGGLLCAVVILPWLAERAWDLLESWGLDGYGWFFGAGVCAVAVLFGLLNVFLRLIGCDALEVTLPPKLAGIRKAGRHGLAWWGIVPIVIGMVIGKTVFT